MSSEGGFLKRLGGLADAFEKLLGNVAVWAYRKPWMALAIAAALTAILGFGTTRLKVNADLAELLPSSFPSVRALHELEARFGGFGYVTVLGENAEPEQLRRFADDVAPRLAAIEDFRYIDYRRPTAFFEEHALYFLSNEDLEELLGKLQERESYEKRKANPLYLDLEDDGPPEITLDDLNKKYSKHGGKTSWMASQIGESYYMSPQKRMIAILAKPARAGLNLQVSQQIIAKTEAVLKSMDLTQYGPNFTYEIGGNYKKKVDQQALIQRDLGWANLASFVLIFVFLAFHFRRVSAIGLVMVPLAVGMVWSYGFAAYAFGILNILTGFVGAILSGMGIENGIHLLARFETEWWITSDREENVRRTFGNTGRGVAITALTTMVAFGGLALSEFRAFREFGIIAAAGMFLFVVSYQLILPALISVAMRLGWKPRHVRHDEVPRYVHWIMRKARPVFVCSVLVLAVFCVALPKLRFNYDLRSLLASNLRSYELDREIDGLVGYSQTPVVMLTASAADETKVAAEVRERMEKNGDASTVRFVAASADLVPIGQTEKLEIIQRMERIVRRIDRDKLAEKDKKDFDRVDKMVHAQPFVRDELPAEVRRQFQGLDDKRDSGFVLVFAARDLSDGSFTRSFAREIRGIKLTDGTDVLAAGEALMLADVIEMVASESVPVMGFAIGLVFLSLWLFIGSFKSAIACILPAAATLLATLGCMPLAGLSLNYINVVMIPLFFGIGIDGGAHLTSRIDAGEPFAPVFSETGHAVTGSLLTNALGFLALVIADHTGLNSLGKMALLGLAMNLLACNVALPSFVAWRLAKAAPQKRDEPSAEAAPAELPKARGA
ncbi:MAG TPA: MMPL family transporter [Myxococcota bacterium]|nr:MMPL family transporter [Myxococcota bacterium]